MENYNHRYYSEDRMVNTIEGAKAVFSDDFQLPGYSLSPGAPEFIEKHRLVQAARPGLIRKLLPIRQDEMGVFTGGCYLFDTYDNAKAYADWNATEYTNDEGVPFPDQPEFLELSTQLWLIAGAEDFGSVASEQKVMRVERWHVPKSIDLDKFAEAEWDDVRSAALAQSMTSVWLLVGTDKFHPQFGLVTVSDSTAEDANERADKSATLQYIARQPSLGADLAARLSGTKVFDRTSWIYMIWHPIDLGDRSPHTAQWPVSPPLPGLQEDASLEGGK